MNGAVRHEKSREVLNRVSGDVWISGSMSMNFVNAAEVLGRKSGDLEVQVMRCRKLGMTIK